MHTLKLSSVVLFSMLALAACGEDSAGPSALQETPDAEGDLGVPNNEPSDTPDQGDVDTPPDHTPDAPDDSDTQVEPDLSDAVEEALDTDPPDQDVMEESPDVMTLPDVPDEGDPFEGRPAGQCISSADCPETALGAGMCSRGLPGGACLGCGVDDHCPGDTICQFGACVTECDDGDDCPPGLRCLGRGLCGALSCVEGVCPVSLFGCSDSGQCERSICVDDGDCPQSTSCDTGRCIEERARR